MSTFNFALWASFNLDGLYQNKLVGTGQKFPTNPDFYTALNSEKTVQDGFIAVEEERSGVVRLHFYPKNLSEPVQFGRVKPDRDYWIEC